MSQGKTSNLMGKGSALVRAAFGVVLFTSFQYFAQVVFYNLGFDAGRNEGLFDFGYGAFVSLLLLIYIKICKKPGENSLIRKEKMIISQWVLVLIIGLGLLAWVSLYFDLAHYVAGLMPKVEKSVSEYKEHVGRVSEIEKYTVPVWDHVLYILGVTISIPLVEELAFRGIVFGELRKEFSPFATIFLSGLFFGVLHLQPIQVIYAVFCGMILGAVYYFCDNILATFVIHAIFNFMGSGVSQLMKSGILGLSDGAKSTINVSMAYVEFVMLLPSVCAIIFLSVIHRNKNKAPEADACVEVVDEQA